MSGGLVRPASEWLMDKLAVGLVVRGRVGWFGLGLLDRMIFIALSLSVVLSIKA